MFFHPFPKSRIGKNHKLITAWYYWYYDPTTGKQKQFVCKGCKNQSDAYAYVSRLPVPAGKSDVVTVHDIVNDMYVPGSSHIDRLVKYGKKITVETMKFNRHYMDLFDKVWGSRDIRDLAGSTDVDDYLLNDDAHSGSWKNTFIENMGAVIQEAHWHGVNITVPKFHRFARNSHKPDVFTTENLNKLFLPENFPSYDFYLLFLVAVSAGLRIGEARALRACQILPQQDALVIDGFCKKDKAGTRTNYNKTGNSDQPKYRVTVVPAEIIRRLEKYVSERKLKPDEIIFQKDSKPLAYSYCRAVLKRAVSLSGINTAGKKFVPHSCRYTYVTRMRRNLSAETVQNLAGHSTVEMTEEYNRAALPDLIQSVDREEIKESANKLFE